MDLKGIRTEDLERELERRQQEARLKEQSLPEPLGEPDFSNLQTVFGPDFRAWRRKQVW